MKRRCADSIAVLVLVGLGFGAPGCAFHRHVSTEPLNREETVALLFFSGLPVEYFESANPDAKAEIYEVARQFRHFSRSATRLIGYIGSDDDVDNLEQFILGLRYDESGGRNVSGDLLVGMQALGRIALREGHAATHTLNRMATRDYWDPASIVVYPPEIMEACPDYMYMGFIFAYFLQQRVVHQRVPEVSQMIEQFFPDPKGKRMLASESHVARRLAVELDSRGTRRKPLRHKSFRATLNHLYDEFHSGAVKYDEERGAYVRVDPDAT